MLLPLLLVANIQAPTPPCATTDTADVAQFFSRFVATLPAPERVARGAFVLVCGHRVSYSAGFGKTFNGAPVNPDRTLFRAASNSVLPF